MPPKKRNSRSAAPKPRVSLFATVSSEPPPPPSPITASSAVTKPTTNNDIQAIIDMRFKHGLKYHIQTATGHTEWVSHGKLADQPRLVEAFHAKQRAIVTAMIDDPARHVDLLCGITREPQSGRLLLLVKWRDQAELHLQLAERVFCKYPKMVLRYLEGMIRVNEPSDMDAMVDEQTALNGELMAVAGGAAESQPWTEFLPMLRPKRILGAVWHDGHLLYLMQWADGVDATDLVLAEEAAERCPGIVYAYLVKLID